jgi:hypothetical protein
MNLKWDMIPGAATVVLEKRLRVAVEPEDLERLEVLAKRTGT